MCFLSTKGHKRSNIHTFLACLQSMWIRLDWTPGFSSLKPNIYVYTLCTTFSLSAYMYVYLNEYSYLAIHIFISHLLQYRSEDPSVLHIHVCTKYFWLTVHVHAHIHIAPLQIYTCTCQPSFPSQVAEYNKLKTKAGKKAAALNQQLERVRVKCQKCCLQKQLKLCLHVLRTFMFALRITH